MVTVEAARPIPKAAAFEAPSSSPRISFFAEFLDDKMSFVSIGSEKSLDDNKVLGLGESRGAAEFEFLSTNTNLDSMLSADELFHEGKLLPKFWLADHCDDKSLEKDGGSPMIKSRPWKDGGEKEKEERRSWNMNLDWFVDEDPSPRLPNCTILWELLRLRKQRAAASSHRCPSSSMLLSPSSSSSSTSSSLSSIADVAAKEGKDGGKSAKRMKKGGGMERTSLGTVRIRPMINMPICTVAKARRLQQPLFPLKKGRVEW